MQRGGEARPLLAQQRPPPVAVHDRGPEEPGRQDVLRQVLRRLHRPHQHPAAAVRAAEGGAAPRRPGQLQRLVRGAGGAERERRRGLAGEAAARGASDRGARL